MGAAVAEGPVFRHSGGRIVKVDDSLGLVFGWLMISKVRKSYSDPFEDYFDLQDHHIPEDGMLKAAADFMIESRATKAMHQGDVNGVAVFAFPLTVEIAKQFGIATNTSGLLFAAKPDAASLAKFKSGEYTGFSIGGVHIALQEVES